MYQHQKNSCWVKQLEAPERSNLTYVLFSGKNAPDSILQLPIIESSFRANDGILLIYVQSVKEGSEIFQELLNFCEVQGLINFSVHSRSPIVPVCFLHSSLDEEVKKDIFERAMNGTIKVLIATSAIGAGVNLPVRRFLGWGLDREVSGVIQAQGRCGRKPYTGDCVVIWVQNPKLHGRNLSNSNRVRELMDSSCLRTTMNAWFAHGVSQQDSNIPPFKCCSPCMLSCKCTKCMSTLDSYKPTFGKQVKEELCKELEEFLHNISFNDVQQMNAKPKYDVSSLSKEILSLASDVKDEELVTQLRVFNIEESVLENITSFLKTFSSFTNHEAQNIVQSEDESESSYSSKSSHSSEYFDDSTSNDEENMQ